MTLIERPTRGCYKHKLIEKILFRELRKIKIPVEYLIGTRTNDPLTQSNPSSKRLNHAFERAFIKLDVLPFTDELADFTHVFSDEQISFEELAAYAYDNQGKAEIEGQRIAQGFYKDIF